MKVISVSKRKLKKMPTLQLSHKVFNTEGKLYVYDEKNKWNHFNELLKIYFNQSDAYLANKIYIISQLIASSEYLDMPELVLPKSLVSVDGEINGFAMPYIENNINLSLLLKNPKVNIKQKLEYLKEILALLEKISKIKQLEDKFFLGDIHEGNFILDIDEQIIKAVDLDSSYINNSSIAVSKYLTFNSKITNNPIKYPHDEEGRAIPNKNTTMLCFIYMLLNSLSNSEVCYWSMNEFYNYLYFLEKMGISKELLSVISTIYTPTQNNDFDASLLDSIDTSKNYTLTRAHIKRTDNTYYR